MIRGYLKSGDIWDIRNSTNKDKLLIQIDNRFGDQARGLFTKEEAKVFAMEILQNLGVDEFKQKNGIEP